jgi:hypothetical protein
MRLQGAGVNGGMPGGIATRGSNVRFDARAAPKRTSRAIPSGHCDPDSHQPCRWPFAHAESRPSVAR